MLSQHCRTLLSNSSLESVLAISVDASVCITLLESLSVDESSLIISVGILPLYCSVLGSWVAANLPAFS
jgi:hypothetical protein